MRGRGGEGSSGQPDGWPDVRAISHTSQPTLYIPTLRPPPLTAAPGLLPDEEKRDAGAPLLAALQQRSEQSGGAGEPVSIVEDDEGSGLTGWAGACGKCGESGEESVEQCGRAGEPVRIVEDDEGSGLTRRAGACGKCGESGEESVEQSLEGRCLP